LKRRAPASFCASDSPHEYSGQIEALALARLSHVFAPRV
jgi:hypothetical protein